MGMHESLSGLREELLHLQEMQDEIHTSPAMVHTHVCHHLEMTTGLVLETLNDLMLGINDTRGKINEVIEYLQAVDRKLRVGNLPIKIGPL